MNHKLKTWSQYFDNIKSELKTFEIRKDDRGFKVGDTLQLLEFVHCERCGGTGREQLDAWDAAACGCNKEHGSYTGRKQSVKVTYITDFGQPEGQIVMGIKHL